VIINKDIPDESGRENYAFYLLNSSGYSDDVRSLIAEEIQDGTPDDIEIIIEDLLLNQVDRWSSFRLKDINRRLDRC